MHNLSYCMSFGMIELSTLAEKYKNNLTSIVSDSQGRDRKDNQVVYLQLWAVCLIYILILKIPDDFIGSVISIPAFWLQHDAHVANHSPH